MVCGFMSDITYNALYFHIFLLKTALWKLYVVFETCRSWEHRADSHPQILCYHDPIDVFTKLSLLSREGHNQITIRLNLEIAL